MKQGGTQGERQKAVAVGLCTACGGELDDGLCVACSLGGLLDVPLDVDDAVEGEAEFNRYELKRRLAAGGMGVVYVAEDTRLKRTVALKMVRGANFAREGDIARFKIEAEAAAGLDHPNIVPIYEIGLTDGQPFFTMKLIEGGNLAERIARAPGRRLSAREIVETLAPIARAVHHAHGRGVLHRDLKPGNVLVGEDGGVWLTDFGLAKLAESEESLTRTSAHLGTPHYMPPEVVRDGADAASTAGDVWSLGVMLWEALYGQPPFEGKGPADVMRKIETDEPSRPSGPTTDRDLRTLALRCMAKSPARRLESAGALADELERWSRGEPIEARPVSALERAAKWVRRKPVWTALIVAMGAGFVSSYLQWKRAESAVASLEDTNDQLGRALTISTATRLVSDARLEVDEAPARACLLAVNAVEITEVQGMQALPEAADALTEILQKVGGRSVSPFRPSDTQYEDGFMNAEWGQFWPALFRPDGRQVLLFDVESRRDDGMTVALHETGVGAVQPDRSWRMTPAPMGGAAMHWQAASGQPVCLLADGSVVEIQTDGWRDGAAPGTVNIGSVALSGFEVWRARFSEDGRALLVVYHRQIASGHWEVRHRRYDAIEGSFVAGEVVSSGSFGAACEVVVLPDLRWLLVLPSDRGEQGACLRRAGLPPEVGGGSFAGKSVYHEAYSEDGRWLVFRCEAGRVWRFDLRGDDVRAVLASGVVLAEPREIVTDIAFSPDSNLLSIGLDGPRLIVATADPPEVVSSLRLAGRDTIACAFSGDGQWVAAGGSDRLVEVWPVAELGRSPESGKFRGLPLPVIDVAFSPDSKTLIATGINSLFREWSMAGGGGGSVPETLAEEAGVIREVACSGDGRWLAVARDIDPASVRGADGVVELVDRETREGWELTNHGAVATGVAFSAAGRWLATVGVDGFARVWDVGVAVATLRGGAQAEPAHVFDMTDTRLRYTRRLAFHPRGLLYCVCGDGILFTWDLNEVAPERKSVRLHSIGYILPDVAVSKDGRWLAVGRHGWDFDPQAEVLEQHGNMVLLFDVRDPNNPNLESVLPGHFLEHTTVEFSEDGRWLAAGGAGKPASVWDLHAEDVAASRVDSEFKDKLLGAVAFSPDGQWLAVGGSDGEIHLWDWREGGLGTRTTATGSPVNSLTWATDTRLTTGGANGRVQDWETDLETLKSMAKAVAGRKLTAQERRRFRN